MLIALSEALETPVSTLLGETVAESEVDTIKALSEKLEILNLQFAWRKALRSAALHWSLIAVCGIIVVLFAAMLVVSRPYLGWAGIFVTRSSLWQAPSITPLNGCLSGWLPLS